MPKYVYDLPIVEKSEVLVVGGGPAGIAASVASARLGCKTMLVERYGFLGGTATAALVGPFMTSYNKSGTIQIVRGIFDELVRQLENEGGAIHPSKVEAGTPESGFHWKGHNHVTPFDSETLKRVGSGFCLSSGVRLRLHSFFVDAFKRSNTSEAHPITKKEIVAVMASKSGLQGISAQIIIDCTGDADVAARLGLAVEKGRETDRKMQPATMFFRIRNIDSAVLTDYVLDHYIPKEESVAALTFKDMVEEAQKRGRFSIPKEHLTFFKCLPEDEWKINSSRILNLDGTDVEDLSRAEIEGREQVKELVQFIRDNVPGCKNAILVDTGAQMGYRETRRIKGKYVLTEKDVVECTSFPDSVAVYAYPMDLHNPEGKNVIFTEITEEAYQIPYRSLLPEKEEQVLVAGRCISTTHEALAATRVMPCCFATGEAAGTAAALSLKNYVVPSELDYGKLKEQLLKQKVYLGDGKE